MSDSLSGSPRESTLWKDTERSSNFYPCQWRILKTFARAEAVLKEACAKDPVDSYWHDTPNFKEWVIIITPKEYKLPVDSEE